MYDVNNNVAGYLAFLSEGLGNEANIFSDEEAGNGADRTGPTMTMEQLIAVSVFTGIMALVAIVWAAAWYMRKPSTEATMINSAKPAGRDDSLSPNERASINS